MNQVKTLVIKKEKIFALSQFIVLIGIATTAPLLHSQPITGSIVNATLFIAVVLLGVRSAILICLIPSLIALSTGLLPTVLAPMIPFIITGNAVLILVFSYLRNKNYWLAMISASLLKFLLLFSFSRGISSVIALMMSWPQLLTALSGGLIAYLFLKAVKKF